MTLQDKGFEANVKLPKQQTLLDTSKKSSEEMDDFFNTLLIIVALSAINYSDQDEILDTLLDTLVSLVKKHGTLPISSKLAVPILGKAIEEFIETLDDFIKEQGLNK